MGKIRAQAAHDQQQLEELSEVVRLLQQIGRWRRSRGKALMRRFATRADTCAPSCSPPERATRPGAASVPVALSTSTPFLRSSPANGFFMFLNNMSGACHWPTIFHLLSPVAGLSYPSKGSYVEDPFLTLLHLQAGPIVPSSHGFMNLTSCMSSAVDVRQSDLVGRRRR